MKTTIQFFTAILAIFLLTSQIQASISYEVSEAFGGNGGQRFVLPKGMAQPYLSQINSIKKISLKVSHRIEKIQVTWSTRNGRGLTQSTGEDGGRWRNILLAKGEYITKVTGRTGKFLNQITIYTSYGNQYGPFGSNAGKPFRIIVPRAHKVIGFTGNSGQCIDKIALVYQIDERKLKQRLPRAKPTKHCRPSPRTPSTRTRPTFRRTVVKKRASNHRTSMSSSNRVNYRLMTPNEIKNSVNKVIRTSKPNKRKRVVDHRKQAKKTFHR